ncbi:hypothetical protein ICN10_09975 [Polynucleobacter sp. 86C-FISCH]|uniref:hypothetical protein n=1 Tax=Polynucleobacter sp. 86C-FISCH TaxID=2689101 RepID=UPI001C0B24A8|nr:hypothetical protein [Polynucleobacter sp. 86C-FISCH]MBU3596725.1 hypothetical protein [Polynucleobacter sp. 86C-FISCH]
MVTKIGENEKTIPIYAVKALKLWIGSVAIGVIAIYGVNTLFADGFRKKETAAVDNYEQRLGYAKLIVSAAIQARCGKPPSEKLLNSPEVMNAIQRLYNEEIMKSSVVQYSKSVAKKVSCNT